ncbi:MAG: hypothetical protein ABI882_06705, partial [Acidobacteriota bacterium]
SGRTVLQPLRDLKLNKVTHETNLSSHCPLDVMGFAHPGLSPGRRNPQRCDRSATKRASEYHHHDV